MSRGKPAVPKYGFHAGSGQAVTYIDRKPVYLGVYDSAESKRRYGELLAQIERGQSAETSTGKPPETPLCVAEVLLKFTTQQLGKYSAAERACLKGALKNAYHNRAIATQEVIDELIQLAKEMQAASRRGEELGLSDDEICFYEALAMNDSAVQAMGIDELKVIAAELVTSVRSSVTIDWTVRETTRAKIRTMIRRILKKHGYPPDLEAAATKLVLEQAEVLCADWAA
ncbi:MAG: DUF3387 domain-containing protein [Planctomycetaceae bacterium]|nr:DUF3387 domain-containing protein [Planctomycetaceae bacterium]